MFWLAAGDHIPPLRNSNIPTHTVCVCQGRKKLIIALNFWSKFIDVSAYHGLTFFLETALFSTWIAISDAQIVKEYERAVIFRLGRIVDRKPKGPGWWFFKNEWTLMAFCHSDTLLRRIKFGIYLFSGLFFVLPCTDSFVKVDLRTVSFDIPPQEVNFFFYISSLTANMPYLYLLFLIKAPIFFDDHRSNNTVITHRRK